MAVRLCGGTPCIACFASCNSTSCVVAHFVRHRACSHRRNPPAQWHIYSLRLWTRSPQSARLLPGPAARNPSRAQCDIDDVNASLPTNVSLAKVVYGLDPPPISQKIKVSVDLETTANSVKISIIITWGSNKRIGAPNNTLSSGPVSPTFVPAGFVYDNKSSVYRFSPSSPCATSSPDGYNLAESFVVTTLLTRINACSLIFFCHQHFLHFDSLPRRDRRLPCGGNARATASLAHHLLRDSTAFCLPATRVLSHLVVHPNIIGMLQIVAMAMFHMLCRLMALCDAFCRTFTVYRSKVCSSMPEFHLCFTLAARVQQNLLQCAMTPMSFAAARLMIHPASLPTPAPAAALVRPQNELVSNTML